MAQTTPLIEQIIQAIETKIKTIRYENGYRMTVNKVSRVWKHWDELSPSDFPIVFISTGGSTLTEETNKELEDVFDLILWFYVRFNEHAAPDDIAQVQLLKLKADIIEAMYAEPTWGNLVREQNIENYETDEGTAEPCAVGRIAFNLSTAYKATDNGLKLF